MVSRIGRDAWGREILAVLQEVGLSAEFIGEDERHPTGTVEVFVAADGQPDFTITKNASWDFLEWREDLNELAASVVAVCFGSLGQRSPEARRTIHRFLQAASANCVRVFDVNLRQDYFTRDILQSSLEAATIVKLNETELNIIAALFSWEKSETVSLSRLLDDFSLDLVALTRGARGSLLVSPQGTSEHPGLPVDAVDTVGAGDAFTAALTVGWLNGWDLAEISQAANQVASRVCLHQGAWTPGEWPLLEQGT
jgi:fructokinase